MPTYTYSCSYCQANIEVLHSISTDPVVLCKKCKRPTTRLFGTGAYLNFVGTGFYQTDYKHKK